MSRGITEEELNGYNNDIVVPDEKMLSLDYPTIPVTTIEPTTETWKFPQLSRVAANGVIHIHQIGFDGINLVLLKGPETTLNIDSGVEVIPKVNRNLQQQATLQARKRFNDKVAGGYTINGSNQSVNIKAMKGKAYDGKMNLQRHVCLTTTKLDGERLVIQDRGCHEFSMNSYSNRTKLDHMSFIKEDLEKLVPYLPEGFLIDGEMYKHGLTKYEIRSLVGSAKNIHLDQHLIEFHVFDFDWCDRLPSQWRYKMLRECYDTCISDGNELPKIVIVDVTIHTSLKQILEYKERMIEQGYEGAVCRYTSIDSRGLGLSDSYEEFMENIDQYKEYDKLTSKGKQSLGYKRSIYTRGGSKAGMVKFKNWTHEEGYIVDVIACNNSHKDLGKFMIEDDYGLQFPCTYGTLDKRREWLADPSLVIGRRFEFKHAGRDPRSNKPQQQTGEGFREVFD